MNRHLRSSIIGAAVTAALVATACTPALAVEPARSTAAAPSTVPAANTAAATRTAPAKTLSAIQAAAVLATNSRITALNKAIPKVTSNAYLSTADRTTILGTLNSDLAAMKTVAATIAADTDATKAASDFQTIFTGYRVFAVAIPQAHYAAAADGLTDSAIPALIASQKALQLALDGPAKSKSTPAIVAEMADLSAQISTAQSSISGVAAFALSVTPAAYNANHSVLTATRASEATALKAAKAGAADVKAIAAALK